MARRFRVPDDLRAMSDAMVRCRTLGHAWDDFIPERRPAKFGERLSVRCVRCTTERHDIVSWVDGALLSREYVYPDDYHLAEKHSRSEFRAALITRRRAAERRAAS